MGSGSSISMDEKQSSQLARLSESDSQLHAQFLALRGAVEKLRNRIEQMRRSEEYNIKQLESRGEHIEQLEMALRESNTAIRESTITYHKRLQEAEEENATLKRRIASLSSGGFYADESPIKSNLSTPGPSSTPNPEARTPNSNRSSVNNITPLPKGNIVMPIKGGSANNSASKGDSSFWSWFK